LRKLNEKISTQAKSVSAVEELHKKMKADLKTSLAATKPNEPVDMQKAYLQRQKKLQRMRRRKAKESPHHNKHKILHQRLIMDRPEESALKIEGIPLL